MENNSLQYCVAPGGSLNRFLKAGTFCRVETFERCTLSGRINEWLKHGFAIHENPCRKEFIQKRLANPPQYRDFSAYKAGDTVQEFGQQMPLAVYFPFGNVRVEASTFYFNPTSLRSYAFAFIEAPTAEQAEFELETCGGVTLWADGTLLCDFAPFTRNLRKNTRVTIPLQAGRTLLTVCLDDLAERDTDYYFGLRYCGGQTLTVHLPVAAHVETEKVQQAETFLQSISLAKEVYMDEPLTFFADEPAPWAGTLHLTCVPAISNLVDVRNSQKSSFTYAFKAGETEYLIDETAKLPPEFYYFRLSMEQDGIILETIRGTQVFTQSLMQPADKDIAVRKQKTIAYLAQTGISNVYRAAAFYALGQQQQMREEIIREDLQGIRQRKDCSDFYFVVVLYLYKVYYAQMSEELRADIRETALGFRYWMDEPGDDVMWFFSENHALLFHICQYFAGTLFAEETFTNSGLTGRQQRAKAEQLLEKWFGEYFKEFITEWNSSAYIPVDVVGLATLYNFEEQPSVLKQQAAKALDDIFRCVAINAHSGVNAVTFGRSYEEHLKGRYVAGTTSLLYLGYGQGYLNRCGMGYISVAMGDYQPPAEYAELISPAAGEALIFQNTQGFEGHVNTYLYKTTGGILSTAVDFHQYQPGYQECITQAALSPVAQVFINHPGEVQPYGKGRPNLWAGNGMLPLAVQYKGTSLLHYKIPQEGYLGYTHAYWPQMAFEEVWLNEQQGIAAARKGNGYIGLVATNGLALQQSGPYRGRELTSPGRQNVWVMELADIQKYENLQAFVAYLSQLAVCSETNGALRLTGSCYGNWEISPQGSLLVNGQVVHHYPLPAAGEITRTNIE